MNFEADGQLYYACISIACGYIGGLTTFAFEYGEVVRGRITKYIFAIIRAVILAIEYTAIKYLYGFNDVKWYMIVGFLAGFIVYKKTIAKIIANFMQKMYNRLNKVLILWRKRIDDTGQKKKTGHCKHGGNGAIAFYSSCSHDISNDNHKRKKGKDRKSSKPDYATDQRTGRTNRRHRSLGKQLENRRTCT